MADDIKNKVDFELVAPEKMLLAEPVEMVVVPGEDGDFGVLAGHSHLISNIRPGVIHIFANAEVQTRIFVSGGFAEITPDRCVVLAEDAIPVEDIDLDAVQTEIGDLNDDLQDASDDDTRSIVEAKLKVAHAKVQASELQLYQ